MRSLCSAEHTSWHMMKRKTCVYLRALGVDVNKHELEAWFECRAFSNFSFLQ